MVNTWPQRMATEGRARALGPGPARARSSVVILCGHVLTMLGYASHFCFCFCKSMEFRWVGGLRRCLFSIIYDCSFLYKKQTSESAYPPELCTFTNNKHVLFVWNQKICRRPPTHRTAAAAAAAAAELAFRAHQPTPALSFADLLSRLLQSISRQTGHL